MYLTREDRRRLAKHLGIPTARFTREYCGKTDGHFHLKEIAGPCQFLEGKRCGVYQGRPNQCRTWPFWPENMKARVWNGEIARFCPGVGKGPLRSGAEIRAALRLTVLD